MRSERLTTAANGTTDLAVPPSMVFHSEFLRHSAGLELFTRLREFISTTWGIDTRTSMLCANEAVLSIEAQLQRRTSVICHRKCQGGLGMCRKQKVEKFIDANLDQRILISGLASLVGLSSSQFQRAFKQSFGETTHMYLIKRRIERAKTIMLSQQLNFAEIALACGFSDQSHMTRLFTRLVGEPPNNWLRNSAYAQQGRDSTLQDWQMAQGDNAGAAHHIFDVSRQDALGC